ncbi:hypothetical protein GGR50DRAFT_548771 [Xylaria sp. CBS 124048]|nr:hypothetical protein GGR50DRAFT_548771 [Xylaria sp. CBS 124048]
MPAVRMMGTIYVDSARRSGDLCLGMMSRERECVCGCLVCVGEGEGVSVSMACGTDGGGDSVRCGVWRKRRGRGGKFEKFLVWRKRRRGEVGRRKKKEGRVGGGNSWPIHFLVTPGARKGCVEILSSLQYFVLFFYLLSRVFFSFYFGPFGFWASRGSISFLCFGLNLCSKKGRSLAFLFPRRMFPSSFPASTTDYR